MQPPRSRGGGGGQSFIQSHGVDHLAEIRGGARGCEPCGPWSWRMVKVEEGKDRRLHSRTRSLTVERRPSTERYSYRQPVSLSYPSLLRHTHNTAPFLLPYLPPGYLAQLLQVSPLSAAFSRASALHVMPPISSASPLWCKGYHRVLKPWLHHASSRGRCAARDSLGHAKLVTTLFSPSHLPEEFRAQR